MTPALRVKGGAVVVALLVLALLSSRASPGFPLADVPRAVGKSIATSRRANRSSVVLFVLTVSMPSPRAKTRDATRVGSHSKPASLPR